ncbi:hypothetical protein PAPYR_9407 [Paratrimastix pyriformis]|uniref:Uncharacterized protein n=1 Tax=Paratrimastix pyriformis TaxID=342808 RepID=A0ABQ8UE17_9EUKA|nr:hypothetical protein PAPYR_9407 [Paratrimastix pyriformis]
MPQEEDGQFNERACMSWKIVLGTMGLLIILSVLGIRRALLLWQNTIRSVGLLAFKLVLWIWTTMEHHAQASPDQATLTGSSCPPEALSVSYSVVEDTKAVRLSLTIMGFVETTLYGWSVSRNNAPRLLSLFPFAFISHARPPPHMAENLSRVGNFAAQTHGS